MAFKAKQCKAIIKSTGKRCRQPAKENSDFCRLHEKNTEKTKPSTGKSHRLKSHSRKTNRKKQSGAPKQNINALKHGAYSPRLLPEEEPIYEEKREAFTAALGTVDVFDEQILHLLSLISTKVDQAVLKGAEHAAYGGMIKQILDLMKELKATRASRDPVEAGAALTYADLFAALRHRFGDVMNVADDNDSTSSGGETFKRQCLNCGFEMPHLKEQDEWRCLNCGHLATVDLEAETSKEMENKDKAGKSDDASAEISS